MKYFLFVFLLFIVSSSTSEPIIDVSKPFDADRVEQLLLRYFLLMTNFSDAPNASEAIRAQDQIIPLFENPRNPQHCDLFFNEEKTLGTLTYLRTISEDYSNDIQVEYSALKVTGCTIIEEGITYAIATATKTLSYKGQTKKVSLVIFINEINGSYKINSVLSPEDSNNAISKCNLQVRLDKALELELFEDFKSIADEAFVDGNYFNASSNYKKALFYQDNAECRTRLAKCAEKLDSKALKDQAQRYFSEKKFIQARNTYLEITRKYPQETSGINQKIKECDENIQLQKFEDLKAQGDKYLNMGYLTKAKEMYSSALLIRSSADLLSKIKQCDVRTEQHIHDELVRAYKLIEQNTKKSYSEAMLIYTRYEGSGKLDAQNYFVMARLLDRNYDSVRRDLGYSSRQTHYLAKEYCQKAMAMGHGPAKEMWLNHFNSKSRQGK